MVDILNNLKKEEKQLIKIVDLQKDEILFLEGNECQCVGIVIEGELEIVSYSYKGREIVFNIITPGMLFGNNLLFSSEKKYKGSVIAKKPSKVALIYKKELLFILKHNEDFLVNYLAYQSDVGKELNTKIKLFTLDNAEERFLYYLFINNNKIHFNSITSLARTINLQRETVSRLITKLIKEDKIVKKENFIFKSK